jgi:UDP-N-acetylglucosamine diphosphorylase/glucosamine-1-phosphate N-acetyltransferase
MTDFDLFMYDDDRAAKWQPFTLTRPAGELLHGAFTQRARADRIFGVSCAGHIAEGLDGFEEEGAPPIVRMEDIDTSRPRLFLSSRAVLDWSLREKREKREEPPFEGASTVRGTAVVNMRDTTANKGDVSSAVAGCFVGGGAANPSIGDLRAGTITCDHAITLSGRMLHNVWDLVAQNATQVTADFDAFRSHDSVSASERAGQFAAINYTTGDLRLGAGVTIEPNVVLDFSHGPIWLDDGVTVRAFTRLAGPSYVGRDSTLLGGPYDAVSIGPVCRIHGEVEESIVLGYSNKAHDGFLGHAYLGRWVNLGAMTTNSDLKNNYGTVRLWTPDGEADTGTMKMGGLMGDHVKTGIGSLINTGTVIGAGSNLFGTSMPPKYVPPFSWGSGSDLTTYDASKFLAVAKTAMGRRKMELSEGMSALLRRAHDGSAAERDASTGTATSTDTATPTDTATSKRGRT